MPDRIERALRVASYGLAVLLLVQAVLMVARRNPLAGLSVPKAPRWTEPGDRSPSNAPPSLSTTPLPGPATLPKESKAPSGTMPAAGGTNAPPSPATGPTNGAVTRGAASPLPAGQPGTNGTAAPGILVAKTNAPAPGATNPAAGSPTGPAAIAGTRPPVQGGTFPGGPGGSGRKPLRPPPPFSPTIQARIDRVTSSEMLAPVFRPPPMALIGIAGHHAFIRTPSGQTSMLREGGESDGIKLIRLGTNRVLIEQAGERKELIIFNGLGSATLLTP